MSEFEYVVKVSADNKYDADTFIRKLYIMADSTYESNGVDYVKITGVDN